MMITKCQTYNGLRKKKPSNYHSQEKTIRIFKIQIVPQLRRKQSFRFQLFE